jgi:uncharacterized protein YbaR (Trm112 family)
MSDEDQEKPADASSEGIDADCDEQPAVPSPRLLEILVCPLTRSTLEISSDRTELISRRARLAYPIRDGIPLLTREMARELNDKDLKSS